MKMRRKAAGFTLVEIMIVVAIIGLLASIAVPNFIHSREVSTRKACVAQLRQLEGAVQTWALERRKSSGDAIDSNELFGTTNYIKNVIICPSGGGPYIYGLVGDPVHVRCTLGPVQGHTQGG
jgi:prepilin-type N-terminal cleavage/methylation domain-containing protein